MMKCPVCGWSIERASGSENCRVRIGLLLSGQSADMVRREADDCLAIRRERYITAKAELAAQQAAAAFDARGKEGWA